MSFFRKKLYLYIVFPIIAVAVAVTLAKNFFEGNTEAAHLNQSGNLVKRVVVTGDNTIQISFVSPRKSSYVITDLNEKRLVSGMTDTSRTIVKDLTPSSFKVVLRTEHNGRKVKEIVKIPKGYTIARSAISRKPVPMASEFTYQGRVHGLFRMKINFQGQKVSSNQATFKVSVRNLNYETPVELKPQYFTASNGEGKVVKISFRGNDSVPLGQEKVFWISFKEINSNEISGAVITYNTPDLDRPIPFINE
ncbi:hypothetical protein FD51_GL001558 [Lacticaseibacillus zeae DSM 20178 = KCTC 3804]|uniref:Uncharacterized protein n=2 Tax=Lacticaseibacillus zeae TaxID=57037 RepID=A0A5R8LNH3_LACZE|nr:hypothetical protein [Lacticaseibacillus zeae]KRK13349.1 hypothetical protein FD51_GL001558 [Lacticaseibacillus zeae DSM 20178 = KCTC 3804]OLS05985.1 hypothetical protein AUQ39_11230 [Lacticaseibacillus casei]TLF38777.1 hypothetical protein FEI14_13615 [Lacticaseibacillus zeae]